MNTGHNLQIHLNPEQSEEILLMLEKTERQIQECLSILEVRGAVREVRHPKDVPLPFDDEHKQQFIDHTCFMVHESERMFLTLKEYEYVTLGYISKWNKINRWLGYIQSNFVTLGWITIGNARDTNR